VSEPERLEEDALGKAYDARLMRRLLRYLRPYRVRVAFAIVLLLCGAALELVGPYLTKVALDRAVPARDSHLIGVLALAYLGTLVVGFALEFGQTIVTVWLGQQVMYDLRREVFGHLQRLGLPFLERNPVGRLMTRVTSDVEALNDLFSSGVVAIFGDIFALLLILGVLGVMNLTLTLVTMAVLPFIIYATRYFRPRMRQAFRDIRVRLARMNAFLQEHLTGMVVVQLYGREAVAERRFRELGDEYLAAHLQSVFYYALFLPIVEVLTTVAFALIVLYGGSEILGGALTVGTLYLFLNYARRFFRPIQDLSDKYNMLQQAMASSERIFALLDTPPAPGPAEPLHLPVPGRGEIEFRDVWFAYLPRTSAPLTEARPPAYARPVVAAVRQPEEREQRIEGGVAILGDGSVRLPPDAGPAPEPEAADHHDHGNGRGEPARPGGVAGATGAAGAAGTPEWDWVLKGVSFRVRPGEKLAIVGHTGAGKTSLISLLMGFYQPQRGEILFDGVPIARVPTRELRARLGLVLQDVFLFSRDIAYNIRLGEESVDEERLRAATTRVGADRLVQRLPQGYATPLGERGMSLSVGERQLLSFARALAFDPLVLLLDEATSSVDSALEQQIEDALETLMRGRTTLVIAHRLSTVQNASRILVLHHGELREEGTHEALLDAGGLYARLYELQFAAATRSPGAAAD
jgi:ATP-binding cassette subfamily B multidrug efflux pump